MPPSCICGHPFSIHQHYSRYYNCAARECACWEYRKPGFLRALWRAFTGR